MLEFHRVLSSLSEVTSVHASQGSASESGSSSSEEESEAEEVAPPPAPAPKAVTHRGRFKRRESAKDVRAYGGEDLTAILGGVQDPFAGLAAAVQAAPGAAGGRGEEGAQAARAGGARSAGTAAHRPRRLVGRLL